MELQKIAMPAFSVRPRARVIADKPGISGEMFSVLSIALFLFLVAFWIAISPAQPTRTLCICVAVGSLILLLTGVILGIVGIACRQKNSHPRVLVMGIIGLSLNGLSLLGMLLMTAIATAATVLAIHRQKTTPGPAPMANASQVIDSSRSYPRSNLTTPAPVIYQPPAGPLYTPTMHPPLRPMYIPSPVPAFTPVGR